jgi:hypothetical protein
MRGLPGSRYLYQELEKIVTYRVEIPRQLINKSRKGEGLVAISGHHHELLHTTGEICHLPLSECRCRV